MSNYHERQQEFVRRAEELVSQMTLEEAASQLRYDAPAIDRLGIPRYNWWNEALHGVARAGTATMFPQAIGLAAMFDREEVAEMARIIATEARAKYNDQARKGDRDIYKGLTFWSPNVNIFRDPRWGRGQETFGEDPFLSARLGVAYVQALQGDGPYMKAAACAKHFAVHSGPEALRHEFDAAVSDHDLWDTYLPAFEACVTEADVEAVMGAYNRTNGEPCCAHTVLMEEILRGNWGFEGHFVSDCWAIRDFHTRHHVTNTVTESAALALQKGCDVNCGNTYLHMLSAVDEGLATEEEIRRAAVRLFTTRFKLGLFDSDCPYDSISYLENDSPKHNAASLRMSRKSFVLLKNTGILPLSGVKTIGVVGPNADSRDALRGNYYGTASRYVTNLEGIRARAGESVRVLYSEGCHLYKEKMENLALPEDRLSEAASVAENSDVVVICLGLDATIEGEEGDTGNAFASGDKKGLAFPEPQRKLLETVCAAGKPVILVVNAGSAMDLRFADEHCAAIVQAWYSGAHGGTALAELLFGDFSPSGRLPVTFYQSEEQLPDFLDYSMENRTYRYFTGEPLYPFGFGLSYASFSYREPTLSAQTIRPGEGVRLSATVRNDGATPSDEVAEVYIRAEEASVPVPRWSLCGFERLTLAPGESRTVNIEIPASAFSVVLPDGRRTVEPGRFTLYIGGSQPDARSAALTGKKPLEAAVTVSG
ncbi:MAG: glycoside hydrolase family 3 protein [Provencibacterium sp.]|jgi:beta-glucosidase|nr:glycoside hydrolase family 3 protein [Provencibacterium sp.]